MRIDIKETKVYQFNELSDEAKQKALECMYDINVDHEWWDYDGLLDLITEEMKSRKIKLSDYPSTLFSYTVEAFDVDRDWFIQLEIDVKDDDIFRKFLRIDKRLWEQCEPVFETAPRRNATTNFWIAIAKDNGNNLTQREAFIIERAEQIMNDKIDEALIGLRNNYEWLLSEEAIIETIEANEYEFTEDGKLY
jgi:hypothetical protein